MSSFSARCIQRAEGYKTQLQWISNKVDSVSVICVDLCISNTIARLYYIVRCDASKNHRGNFQQIPMLSLEKASREWEESVRDCRERHNPERQALCYKIQWQPPLSSHGWGTNSWLDAAVCCFCCCSQRAHPSQTQMEGQTVCAAEQNSAVDSGSAESHS